jgi:hypothetical protein
MKKTVVLLFAVSLNFAQSEQYEKNLNLGNSNQANYTIIKGDNLWNLAQTYYGSGFVWRYIWEYNKYIEDPHWIYPGNLLFIPDISLMNPPVVLYGVNADSIQLYDYDKTLMQLTAQTRYALSQNQRYLAEKFKYYFSIEAQRQAPFIYEGKSGGKSKEDQDFNLFSFGEVINSERPVLVQNQNAMVRMEKEVVVEIGANFIFYAIRDDLRSKTGKIIEPVATGVVKFTEKDYTTIYIEKLWGLLSEGAKIAPARKYKDFGNQLAYKVLSDSLEARVIARMRPNVSLKPSEIVFVDKGKNDGVDVGDHFVLYEDVPRNSKKKHADQSIMEGLVVAVENRTATIRITAVQELSIENSFIGVRQGKVVTK